jgi:hypothetical protein
VKLVAAVRKGHEDYKAFLDERQQTYLREKLNQGEEVPGALIGGAPPSSEAPQEPQDTKEAARRLEERLARTS